MRQLSVIIAAGTLAATIALAGCGSGSSSKEKAPTLVLTSPALNHGRTIPARYTCDSSNVSFPLKWTGVPSRTAELVVYGLKVTPRTGRSSSGKTNARVQWVVAGLSPALHGIVAGRFPRGAVVGKSSVKQKNIYSICPAKGKTQEYVFALFTLPYQISIKSGFPGGKLFQQINNVATARATVIATYKRT